MFIVKGESGERTSQFVPVVVVWAENSIKSTFSVLALKNRQHNDNIMILLLRMMISMHFFIDSTTYMVQVLRSTIYFPTEWTY